MRRRGFLRLCNGCSFVRRYGPFRSALLSRVQAFGVCRSLEEFDLVRYVKQKISTGEKRSQYSNRNGTIMSEEYFGQPIIHSLRMVSPEVSFRIRRM